MSNDNKPKIGGIGQQKNQYRTIGGQRQQDQPTTTQEPEPPQTQKPELESDITTLSQSHNITKQENVITVKPQRNTKTKTQERDKVTYYLEPGQFDKLEELRLAYKKTTGIRLNEQELMRLIVDRLHLDFLL